MDVLTNDRVSEDQAILHDGALLDFHTAANHRILYRTINRRAVCHHGIHDSGSFVVMNRNRICRLRINRPVRGEQLLRGIIMQKLHIRAEIAPEVVDGCHV